jgi:hypothetical protein
MKNARKLPLRFPVDDKRLIVPFNDTADDQEIRPGMEVTEMDGHAVSEIIARIWSLLSAITMHTPYRIANLLTLLGRPDTAGIVGSRANASCIRAKLPSNGPECRPPLTLPCGVTISFKSSIGGPPAPSHSDRSTTIGSTRVARAAGT